MYIWRPDCDIHIHVIYAQGYVRTNENTRAHEYCYCTKDPICVRAVACVCETCHTGFSISGVTCQTSLETGFQRAQPFDGKPSYISIDGTRFVYYLEENKKWYMGGTLGSTTVRALIESAANDVPEYGWQESCSGAWQDSNLRLHGAH